MSSTHPTARSWRLPPADRAPLAGGLRRTNLRTLAAREGRFEHHLEVVARIGDAQLECATASEPLYFAHVNVSDEYVVALPTGDPVVDAFRFLVLLSDPSDGRDAGRLRHGVGDLLLHPYGLMHWPGRLRPPYTPFLPPAGERRAVLSWVFCGARPMEPAPDRPVFVEPGREADAKAYEGATPPLLLTSVGGHDGEPLGSIDDVTLYAGTPPFSPPNGGYALVLDADEDDFWPCDLIHIPPGATLDGRGIRRALLCASASRAPEPPPGVWDHVSAAPFARYEDGPVRALPFQHADLEVREGPDGLAAVRIGSSEAALVPRYWLARMVYRVALHALVEDGVRRSEPRPALGYVETYGGFFYDDRGEIPRLGLRGAGHVELEWAALPALLEDLYRKVAPPGYVEDLR